VYIECTVGGFMEQTINARIKLNNYSNRIFSVVKSKYDLKDKSEAINKFAEIYGPFEMDLEVKEEYINKLKDIKKKQLIKYGFKKMTQKELDKIFE
jgi:hypothetical protein